VFARAGLFWEAILAEELPHRSPQEIIAEFTTTAGLYHTQVVAHCEARREWDHAVREKRQSAASPRSARRRKPR
jgi:hypothetical protein